MDALRQLQPACAGRRRQPAPEPRPLPDCQRPAPEPPAPRPGPASSPARPDTAASPDRYPRPTPIVGCRSVTWLALYSAQLGLTMFDCPRCSGARSGVPSMPARAACTARVLPAAHPRRVGLQERRTRPRRHTGVTGPHDRTTKVVGALHRLHKRPTSSTAARSCRAEAGVQNRKRPAAPEAPPLSSDRKSQHARHRSGRRKVGLAGPRPTASMRTRDEVRVIKSPLWSSLTSVHGLAQPISGHDPHHATPAPTSTHAVLEGRRIT
jgi:hypothetical protein